MANTNTVSNDPTSNASTIVIEENPNVIVSFTDETTKIMAILAAFSSKPEFKKCFSAQLASEHPDIASKTLGDVINILSVMFLRAHAKAVPGTELSVAAKNCSE